MTVNYSQRVRPDACVSPLRFIGKSSMVYDWQGNAFLPEKLGHPLPSSNVMLALSVNENGVSLEDFEQAKAFARIYAVKSHAKTQCRHSSNKTPLVDWIAKSREELSQTLTALPLDKINEDAQKLGLLKLRSDEDHTPAYTATLEQDLAATFQTMPEWMQVLTHHYGAYVTTEGLMENAAGQSFGDRKNPGVLSIGIKAKCMDPKSEFRARRSLHHVLQEELVHELQKYSDFYEGVNKSLNFEQTKWLINELDNDPQHPILKLIAHTEKHGSTLMYPQYKKNIPLRTRELVMDIYDAEIYYRKERELTKEETRYLLKEAFGESAYALSREYLNRWMGQAEKVLAKKIGTEKAHEYHEKWVRAPFTHRITLTQLPEYQLHGASRCA